MSAHYLASGLEMLKKYTKYALARYRKLHIFGKVCLCLRRPRLGTEHLN